jgi:hypothetical protein
MTRAQMASQPMTPQAAAVAFLAMATAAIHANARAERS